MIMHLNKKTGILLLLTLVTSLALGQVKDPPFLKYMNHPWVDSVMKTLSTEERISQLIWVAAFSNRDLAHEVWLADMVRKRGIGGVIFFQDKPVHQAEMINYFSTIAKVPLMVVTDGEWGIGMRLENVIKFPYQLTLGAITNDSLIYSMGREIAGQFRRAGVQINLAPVADVDNNPENPVINFRSFGEEPGNVSRKSLMYMNGLQDNGIFAVAKHFPGHGDTKVDSHLDLPVIGYSRPRLESVELVPFKTLINSGISGVMPGHLWIPALDSVRENPSTVSYPVLTGLLKNSLSFRGLILSDAMNMGGITKYTKPGEAEVKALKAGMDVLEYVTDPDLAVNSILKALEKGELTKISVDEKCRKVLAAKYWAGLKRKSLVKTENIIAELSPPSSEALIRELYANAITVLNNSDNIIPVKSLDRIKIATLAVNKSELTSYQERISKYTKADHYFIDSFEQKEAESLLARLKSYDLVIAGIFNTDQKPSANFGISEGLDNFIDKLNSSNNCLITYFGNPYALRKIGSLQNTEGVVLTYQENEFTEDLAAQLIFGGIGAKGKLPVTISAKWPNGFGIETKGNIRLAYGIPESAGMSSAKLKSRIDSIVNIGLKAKAYPGCEVMVARKGTVLFQKSYGYHTYDARTSVDNNDLYDLASVTKVSSTLAGLMLLDGRDKFTPEATLGSYLPYFRRSNKEDLLMKDLLAHQGGLTAWIPFWKSTVKENGEFKNRTFSPAFSEKYPLKVAQGLYMHKNYRKKIFKEMKKSPVGEKKYLYSDLTFIISTGIIDRITEEPWHEFVTDSIYHRIGAWELGFNPYLKYPLSRIVPTENDSLFRKQLLHGTVHDEGAAMLGGISGHAGLFATANDLMKLMELYRRMGEYGAEQIISRDVMEEYTRVQFPENNNRRGLGFDKPSLNMETLTPRQAYPTKGASPESFGHSGYTGTFVWIDPKYDITYIFLSNRVYPTRNNNLLSDLNIRTLILQAIYDSITE